jgi:uncharacterized protein (TIGR02118 family)
MVKLIALYKKPGNTADFDDHYASVHTPIVKKLPGMKKLEVSKITSAIGGEAKFYLLAEMYFENEDALNAALASPEGKAAGKDLMDFAAGLVQLMIAEVTE